MKNKFNLGCLLMLSLMLFSSTCSTDDDANDNNNIAEIQNIKNQAQSGSWIVTYYFDTDQDETSNFQGYSFTFNSDGELVAVKDSETVEGTWSVTASNSNVDSNDDIDFNISFLSPANFEELSDDWDILQYSSSIIELIDISGGNGGTDYLTFEKL